MPIPPNIPWDQVLRHGPKVVDAASALWDKWKSRQPETVDPESEVRTQIATIVARLEALEEAESAQSELVKNMASEIAALSAAIEQGRARLTMARTVAGVAIVVAIASVAIVLLR